MKNREFLDKLPCASYLVRCYRAPEEDGQVLGIDSGIARTEWDEKGIWPIKPDYRLGGYCSKECRVNESEKELFKKIAKDKERKDEDGNPVRVALKAVEYSIKIGKSPDPELPGDEIEETLYNLIDEELKPSSTIPILDLKYFARYNPIAGFKIAIDGFHNLSRNGIFVCLYSLGPPGVFYGDGITDPKDSWRVSKKEHISVCVLAKICFNKA